MEIELLQNPAADGIMSNLKRKRKRKQIAKKKAKEKNASVTTNNIDGNSKVWSEISDCNCDSDKNLADTDFPGRTPPEYSTMTAVSTEILSEVNANRENRTKLQRKKKKKKKKKAKIKRDAQGLSINQAKMDIDIETTKNVVEGKMKKKRKKRPKNIKKKAESKVEAQNLSEGDDGRVIDETVSRNEFKAQASEGSVENESPFLNLVKDTEISFNTYTKEEAALLPNVVETSCDGVPSGGFMRPLGVEEKPFPCGAQHTPNPNHMDVEPLEKFENNLNELNNGIVVSEGTRRADGGSVLSTCNVELKVHVSFSDLMDFGQCPRIEQVYPSERKLIVLDVNGLLADILIPAPKDCRGDTHISGRAVFKRPFCDDFLKFCFQNFDVGIWSSRSKKIIDRVVEYLLGDLQNRLLFCWDMSHCTQTGFRTLENYHKPLVCKELRKIWESDGPDLRWKKGDYNESNTLLLDDSPYKALLNPLHTAIFPNSYSYTYKRDKSLGPGGDLRVYLEGLLISKNVQEYVKQHPFGKSSINESSPSWRFYSGVLQAMSIQVGK